MRKAFFLFFILFIVNPVIIWGQAQQATGFKENLSTTAQSSTQKSEEELIKPTRPGVVNPAEIQPAGVLQIEYGYEADFNAEEFKVQQTAPLNLRFAAASRFLIELNLETVKSETTEDQDIRQTNTGYGDTRLGFQFVALEDTEQHPALAFAYYVKFPTASEEDQLGTGRGDHRVGALISKKVGETGLDINFAYLNVGREDSSRRADGGQAGISISREFKNNFGFEAELYGQSLDEVQPKGLYTLGALTYKVNPRFSFDVGARVGLTPDAPRFGVFAGFTLGATNPFK